MPLRSLVAGVLLLAAGVALAADKPGPNDWPQWRGLHRDGKSPETGLLKSWPTDGPAKAWTGKNLGSGFGTPCVAAGKVFGMGARDGKDGVWALNEADGKELWFTPIDTVRNANQNNGTGGTPSYVDGKIYAISNNNGVVAKLDANTGKIEWQKSYTKDFGADVPLWGFNDSPLVDGDAVICAPSGSKGAIAALKTSNGEVKWATKLGKIDTQRGGAGYCSPMKATVGGIDMYIVILDQSHGTVGVDAKTGEKLWEHTKNAYGGVAQIPTAIVQGDHVFVSTAYGGGSALLQLIPKGKGIEVKEIWSVKGDPMNHHGNMILLGDKVFFGHGQNKGIPVCYDFKTGEKVWHADREPQGAGGSAAYSYADGLLYVRYENGLMTLVKPSEKEEENKVVSQFKLPEPNDKRWRQSWPHPVIANGKLLIRDQNMLYVYNIKATTN
jgi:outer membrane protein assembly factor BamB